MQKINKGDRVHFISADTGKAATGIAGDRSAGLFGEVIDVRLGNGKWIAVDPKSLQK